MGENLLKSTQTFSQVSSFQMCDMTHFNELREEYKAKGIKLSSTAIYIKALEMALRKYPYMNARLENDEVVVYEDINVGIAVDLPRGLVVVVLPEVQGKPLEQINEELQVLLTRTRENKITMDDLTGGTVTISNVSSMKSGFFQSIIVNNETLMMGFSSSHKMAVVDEDDNIVPRLCSYVMMNINHSTVTGIQSAYYIDYFLEILADPKKYFASEE